MQNPGDSAAPPGIPTVDSNGPSFLTVLKEQTAPKIQTVNAALGVVVIDSMEPVG